jgi:Zn-dependent protease with chaperone function
VQASPRLKHKVEIVRLSEHDDALCGVLLHEIGHVAHGHSLRRIIESSTFAVLATAYYGDADQITAIAGALPPRLRTDALLAA